MQKDPTSPVTWHGPNFGSIDASDLGLRPGEWPQQMFMVDVDGKNVQFYLEGFKRTPDGDVIAAYYSNLGCTVTVFND